MERENLYLIGGSGFIGKNIVRCLHELYNITVFDKYIDNEYFNQYPQVKTVLLNLSDEQISEEYNSPSYIINLASIVTAERDLSLFDGLISSNLKVLLNLYERYKDNESLKLFVQFGSSEEYGTNGSPFREDQREEPNSPYALIKQLTTNAALMLHKNYGFPAMVVRPGNLFGPGQNKSKFIPYVIEQLKANKPLNVTPCEQKRDFIYVDDFVHYINEILKNNEKAIGQIINISSGNSVSLKDIIEFYKNYLHSKSIVNYGAIPYRENEVMDLKCDIGKLLSIINNDKSMKSFEQYIL